MTHACAAGVDVGRDWLDVGLAPSGKVFREANAPSGIVALVARLQREGAGKVVLESIGGYGARPTTTFARTSRSSLTKGVLRPIPASHAGRSLRLKHPKTSSTLASATS